MIGQVRRRRERALVVAQLTARLDAGERRAFGYPAGRNGVDYRPLHPLLARLINNIGEPGRRSAEPRHTDDVEACVLASLAELFGRPAGWWGAITPGSTGAIRHALRLARGRHPDAVLYYTAAAHYSVAKSADALRIDAVRLPTDDAGEMDYRALHAAAQEHPGRPAIVAATAGTPMTEAVDRVDQIRAALAGRPTYVHLDAALTGFTLATHPCWRHLIAGPDSISVSGHKLLGVPQPCGALLADGGDVARIRSTVPYIANHDTTEEGSRAGQLPLLWWWTLHVLGEGGVTRLSDRALAVAQYTEAQLIECGWGATRQPWALTVAFKEPPPPVVTRWGLATDGGWARWIAVPGVTRDDVDGFVRDLTRTLALAEDPAA